MPMLSAPSLAFSLYHPCPSLPCEGPSIDFIIVSSFFDQGYSVPYYSEIACLEFLFRFCRCIFSDQIERIVEEVSLSIDLISRFRSLARDIWCLVNLEIGCLEFSFRFCRWIFVISF